VAIYLNVALFWLERGQVTYGRRLGRPRIRPSKIDPPLFYEEGTPIVQGLAMIETMLEIYGLPAKQPPLAIASVEGTKKRARSHDSAIALESPLKRSRIEGSEVEGESALIPVVEREDSYQDPLEDTDDEDEIPLARRRTRRDEAPIEDEEPVPLGDELKTRQATDDEDAEYQGDTDENGSEDFNPRARSLAPISLQALTADGDTPPPSPKRRGRPPKSTSKGAASSTHSVIKKLKERTRRAMREPSPHEGPVWPPLLYNYGRSRPANMPHLPCPEGINPRVWYGMSYRCQKQRMEGLELLAEMPSESSDWPTTTDEEDNQADEREDGV
jgi:hypothetical protein